MMWSRVALIRCGCFKAGSTGSLQMPQIQLSRSKISKRSNFSTNADLYLARRDTMCFQLRSARVASEHSSEQCNFCLMFPMNCSPQCRQVCSTWIGWYGLRSLYFLVVSRAHNLHSPLVHSSSGLSMSQVGQIRFPSTTSPASLAVGDPCRSHRDQWAEHHPRACTTFSQPSIEHFATPTITGRSYNGSPCLRHRW